MAAAFAEPRHHFGMRIACVRIRKLMLFPRIARRKYVTFSLDQAMTSPGKFRNFRVYHQRHVADLRVNRPPLDWWVCIAAVLQLTSVYQYVLVSTCAYQSTGMTFEDLKETPWPPKNVPSNGR